MKEYFLHISCTLPTLKYYIYVFDKIVRTLLIQLNPYFTEREQAQSRFPVPDLSCLHGHPGPRLSQRHRRRPPATALWFADRRNGVGSESPGVTVTEAISLHYQFLVDSAKMANTGVAQGEGASADGALERLVARVGLPVPDNVDGGHKRSRQDQQSRWYLLSSQF